MGVVIGGVEKIHPHILARDVLHGRKGRLLQGERLRGLRDDEAAEHDPDAVRIPGDGDRMIRAGLFHGAVLLQRGL